MSTHRDRRPSLAALHSQQEKDARAAPAEPTRARTSAPSRIPGPSEPTRVRTLEPSRPRQKSFLRPSALERENEELSRKNDELRHENDELRRPACDRSHSIFGRFVFDPGGTPDACHQESEKREETATEYRRWPVQCKTTIARSFKGWHNHTRILKLGTAVDSSRSMRPPVAQCARRHSVHPPSLGAFAVAWCARPSTVTRCVHRHLVHPPVRRRSVRPPSLGASAVARCVRRRSVRPPVARCVGRRSARRRRSVRLPVANPRPSPSSPPVAVARCARRSSDRRPAPPAPPSPSLGAPAHRLLPSLGASAVARCVRRRSVRPPSLGASAVAWCARPSLGASARRSGRPPVAVAWCARTSAPRHVAVSTTKETRTQGVARAVKIPHTAHGPGCHPAGVGATDCHTSARPFNVPVPPAV